MKTSHSLLLAASLAALSLTAPRAAEAQVWKIFKPVTAPAKLTADVIHRQKPHTAQDGVVEQLANEIDWLEHHIDCYGTIVAKHPDVWGESRLMRHRHEYEKVLERELNSFEVRLNAAISRSDQAFLGMAFALSQAASGTATPGGAPPTNFAAQMISDPSLPQTGADGKPTATNALVVGRTAPFGLPTTTSTPFEWEPGKDVGLEPTVELDQLSRYLQHLHELRRINEGDDIADSPGYSLNLVRIPVSVLPGRHTREGYGAEITVTATPYVTPELLPMTFRTLVINDLVDHFSYPMTRVINSRNQWLVKELQSIATAHASNSRAPTGDASLLDEVSSTLGNYPGQVVSYQDNSDVEKTYFQLLSERPAAERARFASDVQNKIRNPSFRVEPDVAWAAYVLPKVQEATATAALTVSVPASNTRRAQRPLAPSQSLAVYDQDLLAHVAADVMAGLLDHPSNRLLPGTPNLHLMDVRNVLQEELHAAYEFLSTETHSAIWEICVPPLAEAIRAQNFAEVSRIRNEFLHHVGVEPVAPFVEANTTIALAWAVLVESALLNDRLNRDAREVSINKGCGCVTDGRWLPYYGPNPPDEAREAFIQYVNCRWPVQVFALDPVTQDQNVADAYARRRELQVATSLAFASGQISAGAAMRFTRRLEWDMATIDLNRTIVGFEHGHDTFGWRFQPRFQTPPVVSNLTAFRQTLFGGPIDDEDLRQRQLEPGIRECTAIVVMPSFVPYCTFDTRTNWYKLTDPKHTLISNHDTMKLSRAVTAMREGKAYCAHYAHLYRPGEVGRLLKRVDQLDRELPLQSMQVQVPFEQTAGGFELFNHGVTDLAPELVGYYGEPGINPNGFTRLFLVGDGFSVHDTRVIAGGREVEYRLLSRLVMEVVIPPLPTAMADHAAEDRVVDVHVATPYGISSHLLIPLVRPENLTGTALEFHLLGRPRLTLHYRVVPPATATAPPTVVVELPAPELNPAGFSVAIPPFSAMPDKAGFSAFVGSGAKSLGRIDLVDVPLEPELNQYQFGTKMDAIYGDATKGLIRIVTDELNRQLKESPNSRPQPALSIELGTTINKQVIPVLGVMTVDVLEKPR